MYLKACRSFSSNKGELPSGSTTIQAVRDKLSRLEKKQGSNSINDFTKRFFLIVSYTSAPFDLYFPIKPTVRGRLGVRGYAHLLLASALSISTLQLVSWHNYYLSAQVSRIVPQSPLGALLRPPAKWPILQAGHLPLSQQFPHVKRVTKEKANSNSSN